MKNLLLFLVLAFTLTSCSDKQKPNLESDKYSLPFESQKKFMAFKILHFYDGVQHIDAFGDELKSDEWYVQSGMTPMGMYVDAEILLLGERELEVNTFRTSGQEMSLK